MAARVIASDLGRIYPPTAETRNWAARPRLLEAVSGTAEAKRSITNARQVIHDNRLERLATAAHCLTAQAWVEAMDNEPTAQATLSTARRLTTQLRDVVPWFAVCGRLLQARTAVALGQGALARQLITEARARMTPDLQQSLAQDLLEDAEHALGLVKVDGVTLPTLTAAELRILHFLPGHLQIPQIGEHLYLSKNTVKTHVRAIHTKLGVTSRDQAVARARELGLLEPPSTD